MRIIKVEPAPEAEKQVVCYNCGATLAYVKNDVKERHGTDYGGGPDGATWVICANCGKEVILTSW